MDGQGRPRLEQAVESNAGAIAKMRGSDAGQDARVSRSAWMRGSDLNPTYGYRDVARVGWVEARSADTQQRMLR